MTYQVAILTHTMSKGGLPDTRLMKIIREIPTRDEAILVAEALKPHIFLQDVLVVYEAHTEDQKVIWKHDPSG